MYSKTAQRIIVVFVLFLLLSTAPSAFSQIRYNVIDLGSLPGYEWPQPVSINNNGQVVGETIHVTGGGLLRRAVSFDTSGAGNNIDLGTLGGQNSAAFSINNFGQIVGYAESAQDYFATIFDATGAGNNIGLVASSTSWSINNNGQIVGSVMLNGDGTLRRAALFDQSQQGSYIDLGCLPNYNFSEAFSINNAGTIVGSTYNYDPCDFYYLWHSRAVLFNSADPNYNIDLGTLAGYEYSVALSINDNGQIIGRAHNGAMNTPYCNPRAVLFNPNDHNHNFDLGTLPGYNAAEARAINNRGQIVGQVNPSDTGDTAAVLFDPSGNGNNINLNDLIDPVLGWYLRYATCINDSGWVAGGGVCSEGYDHAFLLVPIPAGPADFDQNGKVDFYDFATFAAAWDTAFGDDNYNPACDLETDGQINYYDLATFASGWSPGL